MCEIGKDLKEYCHSLTCSQDKTVPKEWYKAENMTIFPPESALQGTAVDDLKAFFGMESLSKMFAQ